MPPKGLIKALELRRNYLLLTPWFLNEETNKSNRNPKPKIASWSHYIFTFFCWGDCWRGCRWLSRRRFWKGENKHQLAVFSGKRGRSWSRNSSGESTILTAVFSETSVNLGPTLNQPKPMKAGSIHLLNLSWRLEMPFATLQFTQRESVQSNCQLQSGFNADLRQEPCQPISDSCLAAFTHEVTPFCLRMDHQSMFNSTSSLFTLNSQDVVPKRAWFTLSHGQTVPGKLSSENQIAGLREAAACPDHRN